ncbi:MAG: hypothetical protein NVSMB3_05860 [Acidobacteriaceae bacterium]
MVPHIFRFLALRGVRAEVTFGSVPVLFSPGGASRKLIATEARQAVCLLAQGCAEAELQIEAIG